MEKTLKDKERLHESCGDWGCTSAGKNYGSDDVKEAVLDCYRLENFYYSSVSDKYGNPQNKKTEKYFLKKYNVDITKKRSIEVHKLIFGNFEEE
jgi:hypothetical protein